MERNLEELEDRELYLLARDRVMNSVRLRQYVETILYDWPEGRRHWIWVIEADEDEIVAWADYIDEH